MVISVFNLLISFLTLSQQEYDPEDDDRSGSRDDLLDGMKDEYIDPGESNIQNSNNSDDESHESDPTDTTAGSSLNHINMNNTDNISHHSRAISDFSFMPNAKTNKVIDNEK